MFCDFCKLDECDEGYATRCAVLKKEKTYKNGKN